MKFALFGNVYRKGNAPTIENILSVLNEKNVEIIAEESFYQFLCQNISNSQLISSTFSDTNFSADFALSFGGDGTFLKTASFIKWKNIPIVGINMGRLGFMADVLPEDIYSLIDDLFAKRYEIESRTVLYLKTDNPSFNGNPYALNEITMLKQDCASMISIRVDIDNEFLSTYQADGLVVATPTGSTAYSMSVGGPIVVPQAHNLILSPVAPHSLNIRPLVIPDSCKIMLNAQSRSQNFLISLDGRSYIFSHQYSLEIQKADFAINIVKQQGHSFFNSLRSKLMWGIDKRG